MNGIDYHKLEDKINVRVNTLRERLALYEVVLPDSIVVNSVLSEWCLSLLEDKDLLDGHKRPSDSATA